MRKLWRTGLLMLSATGLAAIFLLLILISNRLFNSWLLMQVVDQVPELSIDRVDGLLLGELQLTGLKYQTDGLTISAGSLSYQYQWRDLLAARIRFKSMQLSEVDVLLHNADKQETDPGSMEFMMPLALQIDDFSLQQLTIKQVESIYQVEHVSLALSYAGRQVQLQQVGWHLHGQRVPHACHRVRRRLARVGLA